MTWVVVFCSFLGFFCLLVGVMIGLTWEGRAARRPTADEIDQMADQVAAGFRAMRPVLMLDSKPSEDDFAAIREAGRNAWAIQQQRAADAMAWSSPLNGAWPVPELDPQQAHEAWLAHCEQAEDIANGDPAVDVLDVIHADLDRFIASIRAEAGQ